MYYLTANYYYKVRIILYLYLFIHTYIYHLEFFWLNLQITNYDILSKYIHSLPCMSMYMYMLAGCYVINLRKCKEKTQGSLWRVVDNRLFQWGSNREKGIDLMMMMIR